MNRDEKRARESALLPEIVDVCKRRVIFPRESNGGTWIAANDAGVCFALINWHRIKREPNGAILSRGGVIPVLATQDSLQQIGNAIKTLPLSQLRPFRLIAIVPAEKDLTEWQWNLETLVPHSHKWTIQHWFSSGFDEAKAEAVRRDVCQNAHDRQSNDSTEWLRSLHRSHAPTRGPFSICMHRDDAATVSYTEVTVADQKVTMRYEPGPPCSEAPAVTKSL